MGKIKNKILYLVAIFILVLVIIVVIIAVNTAKDNKNRESEFINFGNNLQSLTDSAINFYSSNLRGICDYYGDEETFKVSGRVGSFFINFNKGEFYENGGVLGGGKEITEEEFLSKMEMSKDEISAYINILKKYKYFSCIEEDVNLKLVKERAVVFLVGPYAKEKKGFVYISDDSLDKDFNQEYADKTYKYITKTDIKGWYRFEYK